MQPDEEQFLRLAIDLARQAQAGGADPFGAALVRDGAVVYQVSDRCVELSDPTYHAELSAISEYCRSSEQFSLAGVTLYSSAEPCPMCAGAIHWARISRVVFSVSQAMLQERSGGRPKPSCGAILQALAPAPRWWARCWPRKVWPSSTVTASSPKRRAMRRASERPVASPCTADSRRIAAARHWRGTCSAYSSPTRGVD